jgi:hypothetical protein
MVSRAASFHGNLSRCELFEEKGHLRAAKIDPQHRSILLLDPV